MTKVLFSIKVEAQPKIRKTWGFSPVERVIKSKKAYDRKREKRDWSKID